MQFISKEESYAERRKLFKNIWDIEDDADTIRPKVIKTLRLDDVDKYVVGKSKREKMKNLRTICNKILDYCDRQEDESISGVPDAINDRLRPKRLKRRGKRKLRKAKPLFASIDPGLMQQVYAASGAKTTTIEDNDEPTNMHLSSDPLEANHVTVVERALVSNYKSTSDPENMTTEHHPVRTTKIRRRLVRKKRSKRKKLSEPLMHPLSGTSNNTRNAAVRGRAVLNGVKQVLAVNKILISTPNTN